MSTSYYCENCEDFIGHTEEGSPLDISPPDWDDVRENPLNNTNLCDSCFEIFYVVCRLCGELHLIEEDHNLYEVPDICDVCVDTYAYDNMRQRECENEND